MGVPLRQSVKIGTYLARQKLSGRDKFPLIVELEPLFACNLECNGCGKIQYPTEILRKRLTVEQAVAAIEECGAPMVSIAGGEPLLHPEIDKMTKALLDKGRFVYLCTNALLLERKLDRFEPHHRFSWVVHVDGLKERHDESVSRDGTFDKAVAAIKAAQAKGFKVTTNTTFFSTDSPETVREVLDFLNDDLQVDQMMISPGYAYEKAPDQVHFLSPRTSHQLFAEAFSEGKRKHWRLNHSPLFLDFLEGKVEFECTPWGIPSYSVFGWQRPCYLMADGYAETYKELIETTDWDQYGRGKDPRCANCMAHCGYEPSAVLATTKSLRQSDPRRGGRLSTMGFDLPGLLAARTGEGPELWARYLNPQTAKVLRSIGLDRNWVRGEGPYIWDDTGTRYLDWLAGFGVFGLGRNHPVVRQALKDVMDAELADMVKMDTPLLAGLLGEQLIKRAPFLDRVYLCNSGTEAVETAIKFARYATGRDRVLYCDHAYHGLTAGALSVNGAKEFREGFGPLLPGTKVPFGDLTSIRQEVAKGDVAALIVEPVQGKGVQVAPPGYLTQAAELLHANGAVLICDEVQAGLARTGRFFSFEHDGVEPDLVTVAKTLSGGAVPIGATLGTERIFAKVYSSMTRVLVHDTTYSHNNMAAAAGLAALSVIDDEDLLANAAERGAELISALRRAAERYDFVTDVRGRGLMIGIEFGRPASWRLRARYSPLTLARKGLFTQMIVCDLFERHHILTQTAGDHMDVLKLLPPLATTSEDVEWFMSAFCSVMDGIQASSRPIWHFAKGLTSRTVAR